MPKRSYKNYKFIGADRPYLFLIVWNDHNSTGDGGWLELEKVINPKPIPVRTAGWVVSANKECIAVVSTLTPTGLNQGSMNILKSDIVSVKKISDGPNWHNLERESNNAVHRSS